ncbi:gp30 DNA ligase [Acinetobacter phage Acj9]|uniref:DNA ligase n=1 Tax=Acinetobacter phage Acj9 TaxID=760939 RepID=E5EPY9_9CAUD|nr:gp30 DNA ligase [Acinetobacter phage Acj9]ADG60105.1 gp30 DNA ligase [Acinetobacter phage Acj9]
MILDVLNSLAATDSTNEKLAILKANMRNGLLETVYRLAYHPRLQYGIKKIPYFDAQSSDTETTLPDALCFIETILATRLMTGNKAIAELQRLLNGLPEADAEVVRRVIKRDLECGASSTLANKVWKNLIPKQPQMLASSMSEKALSEITYPAFAQLKADGARCFAEIRGEAIDDVKLLSRAGNEYLGLTALKYELISATREYREKHGPVMVDGEIVAMKRSVAVKASKSLEEMFDSTLEQVTGQEKPADQKDVVLRSETNGIANKSLKGTITPQEAELMSFQVWDLVPLNVVYAEKTGPKSLPYDQRFEALAALFKYSNKVFIIENTIVNNLAEAKAIYKEYVLQGLEGIILKNIEALWENKRSKNLVKFKEEISIDLRIVGVQVHSKDANKLGAVLLESDDRKIRVRCGSGFTDTNAIKVKGIWVPIPFDELDELNRTKLMLEEDELIGTIAEIKCNGWIAAEGRTDSVSLFLPIIKQLRRDKDETNSIGDVFPEAAKYLDQF